MMVFGRIAATFGVLMVVGYAMIVAFLPAPAASDWHPDDGASAAVRLSQEARILVSRKPVGDLQ